jgi:hypothetical protein
VLDEWPLLTPLPEEEFQRPKWTLRNPGLRIRVIGIVSREERGWLCVNPTLRRSSLFASMTRVALSGVEAEPDIDQTLTLPCE